jgi:hypothetical protein
VFVTNNQFYRSQKFSAKAWAYPRGARAAPSLECKYESKVEVTRGENSLAYHGT